MATKSKKKNLEKLLLNPVPRKLTPEAFYTIEAPQSFNFPIESTFLQNINIIEQYDPSDINEPMSEGTPSQIFIHESKLCQLKKKGITIRNMAGGQAAKITRIALEGVSSFHYNGTYLAAALDNKSLVVYGPDARILKQINSFSQKVIRELHIVTVPLKFQGVILLTSSGNDITVKRLQKSFFSTLSCKYSKEIMKSKEPYVQFVQLPKQLKKKYFQQDAVYKSSTIIACLSCTQITILRINHGKITDENFVDILYNKAHPNKYGICYASWGEAMINSRDADMRGLNLVLTSSFGEYLYLLSPIKNSIQVDNVVQTKFEWLQSFPFKYQKDIVFCQYIKENEVLLIAEDGKITIFYTGSLEFFEREISSSDLDLITYQYKQRFRSKYISVGQEAEIRVYNRSFAYAYGDNQIYYLTEDKVGAFVYCTWIEICQLLTREGNYASTMNFLIALYHKANRFDLGFKHTPQNFKQLSQYIEKIALEYVHTNFGKYTSCTEMDLLQKLENRSSVDEILTPIEFLTTTREYTFLFQKLKLVMQEYIPESVFFKALQPFIAYGRIKYIPDEMLKYTLDYYIANNQSDIVERLAIHFDLKEIQKGIIIKCCLDNVLVVSLAFICTQGNQSEFVTPFVKFWGIAEDERKKGEIQYAQFFAMRALWYVKLCLQRSMALKAYSYQKFGYMISILTSQFFTESMITGLLLIRSQTTLESLSHYFSIQNATIVNQFCKLKIAPTISKLPWIDSKEHRQRLEMMLSAIHAYVEIVKSKRQTEEERREDEQLFYLFLSKVILFKTIKFVKEKYIEILVFLMRHFTCIKLINYGVDRQEETQEPTEEEDQIKASEYINKILTLSIQQAGLTKTDLTQIFIISRQVNLTELQAQIKYISGGYGDAIKIYLEGSAKAKQMVFSFLQNSFKALKLENKKKEKRLLEKEVKDRIKDLINLNPESTTKIVKAYMPESQEQLIQALSEQQSLQLQYLEELMSTDSPISQRSLKVYISLMSKLKPLSLLQVLKNRSSFPVEYSIQICQQNQVYDCLQYLYERSGDIQASVKVAVKWIQQVLQKKYNSGQVNQEGPYIKIADITSNVVNVCIKNKSEEVWEELFNATIDLYNRYKDDERYSEEVDLLYQINAKVLYELLNHVSLDHCIYLIRERYGKLDLGGRMNKAFTEVLSNYGFNENIMFSARDLNSRTLAQLHQRQLESNLRGYSIDEDCNVCGQPIDRSNKCVGFHCGHSYHRQCVVTLKDEKVESRYCVQCLSGQQNQFLLHIYEHGVGHRIKINKMFEEVLMLKTTSLEQFKQQQNKYISEKQTMQRDKVVDSTVERMKTYEASKALVDETSNKVRSQLEKGKRRRRRD